jgi:shikimate dehydrogenase
MRDNFRLGLIGWPLEHSLSPVIQQAALKAHGLEGDYRCFPVEPLPEGARRLDEIIEQMRKGKLHGLNVTVPHKEAVLGKLDHLTTIAKRIGAVNTIFKEGTKLVGDNTDQAGFLLDFQTRLAPETGNAIVLGAGGAARAVVTGLLDGGWKVWVAARRVSQAERLAKDIGLSGENPVVSLPLSPERLRDIALKVNLIVNATSVGMSPDIDGSPWPEGVPFPEGACLYDLVYTPQDTRLAKDARAEGLRTVTGLGMLVQQAALAFERWTGRSAPREEMVRAAERAASRRKVGKKGEGS